MWPFCWDLVNLKLMMLMFSPLEDFNFSMSIYVRIAFYLQISHGMSCGRLVGAPALRFSVPLPFPLDAKALPDELENEQSWLVRSIFIHFYILQRERDIYIDYHLTFFWYVRVNRYIYIVYVSYLHVHSLVIEVMLVNGGERSSLWTFKGV